MGKLLSKSRHDQISPKTAQCEIETFYVESQHYSSRMRKKKNVYNFNKRRKVNVIQSVPETPMRLVPKFCPTNLIEQKDNFLRHGIVPNFNYKASTESLEKINATQVSEIRLGLLSEAKRILELTKSRYGSVDAYTAESFGEKIDYLEASAYLSQYLSQHNIDGSMKIIWSPDLNCSARMMWHGPGTKYNRPEARKYTLCVKKSADNSFLRENGIRALADHEIGTHFFRMHNDGLQVWFSNRSKFGLIPMSSREMMATEEGLACVNTLLQAKHKLLALAALLYYTACMSAKMSFKALFDHLEVYVKDPEQRCKHVMRVKRGQSDVTKPGGYGKDQCYFEGAVEILRNIDNIDFPLLMCGKIHLDEVHRVRRMVRQDCVRMPHFLKDVEKYKQQLRHIANVNGLAHYSKSTRRRSSCIKPRPGTSSSFHQSDPSPQLRSASGSVSLPKTISPTQRKTCWTKSESRKKLLCRPESDSNKLRPKVERTRRSQDIAHVTEDCNVSNDANDPGRFGTLTRIHAPSPEEEVEAEEIVVTRFGTLRKCKNDHFLLDSVS